MIKVTKEDIVSLNDVDLLVKIIDYISSLYTGEYGEKYNKFIASLPKGLRMVNTTFFLEGEIGNGGIIQYFWNPNGVFVKEAIEAYKLIGVNKQAKLVQDALDLLGDGYSLDQTERIKTLQSLSEKQLSALDEIDKQFDVLKDEGEELRIKYIKTHPEEYIRE